MSMIEQTLAKYTFLVGLSFFVVAFFGDYMGLWDYPLSPEAPELLNLATRSFWGIGFLCILVNFFIMWRHMFRNQKWGWFFSVFIGAYLSTLLYYHIHYSKQIDENL